MATTSESRPRPSSRTADISAWQNLDMKYGGQGRLTQMHLSSPQSAQDIKSMREYERMSKPRTAAVAKCAPASSSTRPKTDGLSASHGIGSMPWDGSGEPSELQSPGSRPPPAGMRGAFSWGVGPNAYEVDGRPGTRGGGPACELDGRPGTRGGGVRPPSRMQTAAGTYGQFTAPGQLQPGTSRAMAASAAGTSQRLSLEPMTIPRAGKGGGTAGAQASPGAPSPSGKPGRVYEQQRPGSRQQALQLTTKRSAAAGPFSRQRRETEDIEQQIEALSDEEEDEPDGSHPASSLDDLNSYLSTLDQNDARASFKGIGRGRGSAAALAGTGKGAGVSGRPPFHPQHEGGAARTNLNRSSSTKKEQLDSHAQQPENDGVGTDRTAADAAGIPPQFSHLPRKAVRLAMKLVDRMVAQAVKTGQVNMLIKEAEQKALLDEEAAGGKVVLEGDDWKEAARMQAGAIDDGELAGLMSNVRLVTPKVSAVEEAVSAPRPEDDFRYIQKQASGGAGAAARRQQARPASRPVPPQLPAAPPPTSGAARLAPLGSPTASQAAVASPVLASPGMSRYGMHRI